MKSTSRNNGKIDAHQIKERIDATDFYTYEGQEFALGGRNHWKQAGLCPFHDDRQAGSFYIHDEQGAFKCFSCEAKGGDIIAFIQMKYQMSFLDAINKLKSDWRVS